MQRPFVDYISIASVSGMQKGKPADIPSCMRATSRISSPKWTADSCVSPGEARRTNALALSDFLSVLIITAGALLICRMICTP